MTATLTPDQSTAIDAIITWLAAPTFTIEDSFFVLSGFAGTGKTFCVKELINRVKGRFVFTAPTNKATKVLRESLTSKEYKPECRTTYSLLGLRLEPSGEIRELKAPEDPIDLSKFKAVIVDEGSMVNAALMKYIRETSELYNIKFLFLGDSAQLPPVKEDSSAIWKLPHTASLTKIMRYDNQILTLATAIREALDKPVPTVKLQDDHDENGGVYKLPTTGGKSPFLNAITDAALAGDFNSPGKAKIIAWRNATVDTYNAMVRRTLFGADAAHWLPTDRVTFLAPAKNLSDEVVATTDDEGVIEHVATEYHAIHTDIKTFSIRILLDDNRLVIARVLHPDSERIFQQNLNKLLDQAKATPRAWKKFWEYKEAFHLIRHAYATTAHRSQGSTYDSAYVDWQDILLNQNRQEAFRCLYVACTRPKTRLFLA